MQSESQLREGSELAQRKKTIELVTALKSPPQKRSSQQANRIAQFLSTIPGVNKLTPGLLNRFVHQCFGTEYFDGQIIYRASETATYFFIIVTGHVVLTDVKENKNDEGDDNVISRLNPRDWFGHEEILSSSRRAFTASAVKGETFCIRVPLEEYSRAPLQWILKGETFCIRVPLEEYFNVIIMHITH
ncbi:cyclic nucleotide-binding-like protein [Dunaliella salina]|uniref:Cyclic nucleotide-binding-like protein n=1 Tax=Dunaliella salina TaxID=3046 RepID=A0ABQ7GJ25_DUNSA|nr:cyclic nucleotide-binding-like protein [Dunaliella salina]|eukprot:KAF5834616.1 cyclic nucleotide-binding-like protein [Dunaliella salina]